MQVFSGSKCSAVCSGCLLSVNLILLLSMKKDRMIASAATMLLFFSFPSLTQGADSRSLAFPVSPNMHGKSLTTPVGWGASGGVIYFGAGGTVNSPYSNKADGSAAFGLGVGNPKKSLGAQMTIVSLDMNQWDRYSMYLHFSRSLGKGTAVGVGVENIMLSDGGDADESYYAVVSHSVQARQLRNKKGKSKLHFSVGVGSGRFGEKSSLDIASGKGRYGSYVFGNAAYELFNTCNAIVDWSGINLNAGLSKTFIIQKIPLSVTVGAADLTRNSGDGVRFTFGVGTGFKL